MKKALIHYFSGTGNSLLAAKKLSVELQRKGYASIIHSMENGHAADMDHYTIHIFCFPIYATAMPHIMIKYIKHLPDGKNVKAAVISTNGKISTKFRDGYQGWALHQARLLLRLRNYNVFLSDTLDFPHNVTVAGPPRKEKYNRKIIEEASAKIPLLAEKIAKGEKYHRKVFLPNFLWSIPFGVLFSFIGRHILGKLFVSDSGCERCGLCVKRCPAKAIILSSEKLRWNWSCEGCLRCINICPQKAIQVSTVRLSAFIAAVFVSPDFLIGKNILSSISMTVGGFLYSILWALMYTFIYFILVAILDWFIDKLSNVPVLKNIIGFGHTKFFKRYSAKR